MLKRLIEVALPLKEVSEQSARGKSVRSGRLSSRYQLAFGGSCGIQGVGTAGRLYSIQAVVLDAVPPGRRGDRGVHEEQQGLEASGSGTPQPIGRLSHALEG